MKTLRFAFGKTINTGNFNSVRIDYEETVELLANEDFDTAYDALRSRVYDKVYGEAAAVLAVEVRK